MSSLMLWEILRKSVANCACIKDTFLPTEGTGVVQILLTSNDLDDCGDGYFIASSLWVRNNESDLLLPGVLSQGLPGVISSYIIKDLGVDEDTSKVSRDTNGIIINKSTWMRLTFRVTKSVSVSDPIALDIVRPVFESEQDIGSSTLTHIDKACFEIEYAEDSSGSGVKITPKCEIFGAYGMRSFPYDSTDYFASYFPPFQFKKIYSLKTLDYETVNLTGILDNYKTAQIPQNGFSLIDQSNSIKKFMLSPFEEFTQSSPPPPLRSTFSSFISYKLDFSDLLRAQPVPSAPFSVTLEFWTSLGTVPLLSLNFTFYLSAPTAYIVLADLPLPSAQAVFAECVQQLSLSSSSYSLSLSLSPPSELCSSSRCSTAVLFNFGGCAAEFYAHTGTTVWALWKETPQARTAKVTEIARGLGAGPASTQSWCPYGTAWNNANAACEKCRDLCLECAATGGCAVWQGSLQLFIDKFDREGTKIAIRERCPHNQGYSQVLSEKGNLKYCNSCPKNCLSCYDKSWCNTLSPHSNETIDEFGDYGCEVEHCDLCLHSICDRCSTDFTLLKTYNEADDSISISCTDSLSPTGYYFHISIFQNFFFNSACYIGFKLDVTSENCILCDSEASYGNCSANSQVKIQDSNQYYTFSLSSYTKIYDISSPQSSSFFACTLVDYENKCISCQADTIRVLNARYNQSCNCPITTTFDYTHNSCIDCGFSCS